MRPPIANSTTVAGTGDQVLNVGQGGQLGGGNRGERPKAKPNVGQLEQGLKDRSGKANRRWQSRESHDQAECRPARAGPKGPLRQA